MILGLLGCDAWDPEKKEVMELLTAHEWGTAWGQSSGMSNTYTFSEDGTYTEVSKFNINGSVQEIKSSGTFEIDTEDDIIMLYRANGEVVSETYSYEIEDGELVLTYQFRTSP